MILTEEMERTLKKAWEEAKRRRNEFITLEHILFALTYDTVGKEVLEACGADIERLRKDLIGYLESELETLPESSDDPIYTIGVQHVLQLAEFHVQSTRNKKMDGGDVLAALFREDQSNAVYFLGLQDISRLDIVRYISHGIRKDSKNPNKEIQGEENEKISDPLQAFCVDLTARAKEGKLDPMVGREEELDRTIHILCRRRKNNPIFVGEAGF